MAAPLPKLDLPDTDRRSTWPWVIVVLTSCALAWLLAGRLVAIPESLERETRSRLGASGADGVTVQVDGRDVTLAGELDDTIDRRALIERTRAIEGVRIVRDEIVVVDPEARAAAERAAFRETLAAIDLSQVAFEPGSASIAAASAQALADIARLMRERPDQRVRVAGHTDNSGRAEANLALSRERALAVADDLAIRGIDRARIIALGYGATQPIADNATETGRARNRRIDIVNID